MPSNDLRYQKRYRLDVAQGRPRSYVPAGPVMDHLRRLQASGLTINGIAELSGASTSGIGHLIAGRHTRVQRRTAARILRVQPRAILSRQRPDGLVPSAGTIRRIQALMALGWRHSDLRAAAGKVHTSRILAQSVTWVTRATHDAIVTAYDELSMTLGPSDLTRSRARRAGYAPPLAWDDEDLDNPVARPHIGGPKGRREYRPCGTIAAARRHYRAGEPPCESCRQAESRALQDRKEAPRWQESA